MDHHTSMPDVLEEEQFGLFDYVDLDGIPTTYQQTSNQPTDGWIDDDPGLNSNLAIRWNLQLETENPGTPLQRDPQPFEPGSFHDLINYDSDIDDLASSTIMEQSPSLYSESQSSPAIAEHQPLSSSSSVSGSSPSNGSDQVAISPPEELPIQTQQRVYQTIDFTCRHCARSFTKKYLRTKHEQIHTKPITCPLAPTCQYRTARNRDMRRHIGVHHDGTVSRFTCSVSGCRYERVGFNRKDNLARHMRRVHSRLTP
ncbi:hypothetical protein BDZ45DRAFT_110703 [Acephala macrosclerotiorum]|nr:hypothetical protein BDZ45DRAFT_110703 [Acephala macrosclerotiorum]